MSRMDPVFQSELMTALSAAVTHMNNGSEPTTAVVKAAEEADFNLEQARRLGEKVNALTTLHQYGRVGEKTAAPALADLDDVERRMIELRPAACAEKVASAEIPEPGFYDITPVHHTAAGLEKIADSAISGLASAIMRANATASATWRAHAARNAAAAGMKSAETLALAIPYELVKLADTLVRESVRVNDATPVVKLAEYLDSRDAGAAGWVRKAVLSRLPGVPEKPPGVFYALPKFASDAADELIGLCELECEADRLRKEAADLGAQADETIRGPAPSAPSPLDNLLGRLGEKDAQVILDFREAPHRKARRKPSHTAPDVAPAAVPDGTADADNDSVEQDELKKSAQAGPPDVDVSSRVKIDLQKMLGLGSAGSGGGDKKPTAPAKPKAPSTVGMLMSLPDQVYGALRKNQARKVDGANERLFKDEHNLVFQELAATDPVLRDASDEDMQRAMSTLISLAPTASTNPEVARAALRQLVHADALSPLDAGAFMDLERKALGGQLTQQAMGSPRAFANMGPEGQDTVSRLLNIR